MEILLIAIASMVCGAESCVDSSLPIAHVSAHRWRFALASGPLGEPCLFDPARALGACGDWCLGGRVEAAFLSGRALAGRLLGAGGPAGQDERPALRARSARAIPATP